MKAVYETESGSACLDGVSSAVRVAVREVLKRAAGFYVFRIWIVEDEASSDASAYVFTVPDWKVESVRVVRADGESAKVWLGIFSDECAWDAFEREFPISCPVIEPGDFDSDGESYRGRDRLFFWGYADDDVSLGEWYEEVQRCLARLPSAIIPTSSTSASRTSTCSRAASGNTFASTAPRASRG